MLKEEYEILKNLDDKWKWIARDRDTGKLPYSDMVHVYEEKPFKTGNVWTVGYGTEKLGKNLFQFIQWEDEEPHNIQELIEEYEENLANEIINRQFESLFGESEETEVKSIQDLIDKWENYKNGARTVADSKAIEHADMFISDLNQLDEPEVLSQEWIDDESMSVLDTFNRHRLAVPVEKLENLLVPKQELPVIPKFVADYIDERKELGSNLGTAMTILTETLEDVRSYIKNNEELFARAWLDGYEVEEQRYYVQLMNNLYLKRNKHGAFGLGQVPLESDAQFTEQEIKDYDERFWPFAVKVEELEE